MEKKPDVLKEFMSDFKLDYKKSIVCFDALLEFTTGDVYKKLPCEIYIHSILRTHLIYLLDIDVKKMNIPASYIYNHLHFAYEKNKALVIKGIDWEGLYTLKILPQGGGCKPSTIQQLRQKILN